MGQRSSLPGSLVNQREIREVATCTNMMIDEKWNKLLIHIATR
jgi:hypothetical protein